MGRRVKLIYYVQQFFVGWDIRHRSAVVGKTNIAPGIDHTVQRHASQLEQVDFLPVDPRHRMVRIWQADKGYLFIFPVLLEVPQRVGSNSQNFCPAADELLMFIPQARQLRATVGSHKAAQKGQDNRLAAKIG